MRTLSSDQKALELNLDPSLYGTFAEVGAGQEVARHFFRAGGASGTMAKTISAYDMTMSDLIYGKSSSGRYVSRDRLGQMLQSEFDQCVKRLGKVHPRGRRYFAFANTVVARQQGGHGWIGVRFQHAPRTCSSNVVIHVRLLDRTAQQQQSILGDLGVNLIYACFYRSDKQDRFVASLTENLSTLCLEIDMIHIEGPGFQSIDERLLCLDLVKRNFCRAALFDTQGKPQLARDYLYNKSVLVLRGSFRPPTNLNMDMLKTGRKKLEAISKAPVVSLAEISMSQLLQRGQLSTVDFITTVDLLAKLHQEVLVTHLETHDLLGAYLESCTRQKVAFVMGAYTFEAMFDAKQGSLELLGRIFGKRTIVFFYPAISESFEGLMTLDNLRISPQCTYLLLYLLEQKQVLEIEDYDEESVKIWSRKVLQDLLAGGQEWKRMVPPEVVRFYKKGLGA